MPWCFVSPACPGALAGQPDPNYAMYTPDGLAYLPCVRAFQFLDDASMRDMVTYHERPLPNDAVEEIYAETTHPDHAFTASGYLWLQGVWWRRDFRVAQLKTTQSYIQGQLHPVQTEPRDSPNTVLLEGSVTLDARLRYRAQLSVLKMVAKQIVNVKIGENATTTVYCDEDALNDAAVSDCTFVTCAISFPRQMMDHLILGHTVDYQALPPPLEEEGTRRQLEEQVHANSTNNSSANASSVNVSAHGVQTNWRQVKISIAVGIPEEDPMTKCVCGTSGMTTGGLYQFSPVKRTSVAGDKGAHFASLTTLFR